MRQRHQDPFMEPLDRQRARLMRMLANRGQQNGWHMVRHDGVLRRVPTYSGPGRKTSLYMPHQGERERARRARRAA